MTEATIFIKQMLTGKENQLLNKLEHCNFKASIIQFFNENDLILEKEDVLEGEKENFIDQNGVFKYKNTVKLKKHGMKIQMSCYFKTSWEFYFEQIMNPHLDIQEERIINRETDKMILVLVGDSKYLIPLSLAEKLDLEECNEKKLDTELKESIICKLKEFEIKKVIKFE